MADLFLPMPAKISNIQDEAADKTIKTFTLSFTDEKQAEQFDFMPGQFIELFLPGKGEFPVGIASSPAENGCIKVTVKRAGAVTTYLHAQKVGDFVGIRGPLGKPFPWKEMSLKNIVLIGGGFAFTTLRAAIHHIMKPENRQQFKDIHVFYGAVNPGFLLYRTELEQWHLQREDININLTVDRINGLEWGHEEGVVPEVVSRRGPLGSSDTIVLVCGPPIMIKYTIPVLNGLNYQHDQIFVSSENKMKCGIGLCGRCNIGPKFVCKDGPVFSLEELDQLPGDF